MQFFHSEGVVVLMRIRIFIIFSHFSCKGRKKLNLKKYLLIDTIDERALIEKCMQSTKKIFTYIFLILFSELDESYFEGDEKITQFSN